MKKIIFLSVGCFLLFQSLNSNAQTKMPHVQNDLTENNLRGKVKSMIVTEFSMSAGDSSLMDSVKSIQETMKDSAFRCEYMEDSTYYKFDIRGNIIEKYHDYMLGDAGPFQTDIMIVYDSNDNKVKETTTYKPSFGSDIWDVEVISFKYNSLGNVVEETTNNSNYSDTESFFYNNYGKLVLQYSKSHFAFRGGDNFEIETDSFIYDSTGYMVIHNEMEVLNSEKGQETEQGNKSYIRYNTLGLKIELIKCNSDDSLIYESNYKYDPNGNLIEENLSYQKNEVTRTCMGSFADPYGVKVGDFYRYSYKYDYDTVGNCIYRYEYRSPFSEILTVRLLEYY